MKELEKPILEFVNAHNPTAGLEPTYMLKGKIYEEAKNSGDLCAITVSPFWNCQVYTIGGFESLFNGSYRKHLRYILEKIQNQVGKSRLLIDIYNNTEYNALIREIFKDEDVVFSQEYTNNTGSPMCMYMLRTGAIGYIESNDDTEDWEDYGGDWEDDDY